MTTNFTSDSEAEGHHYINPTISDELEMIENGTFTTRFNFTGNDANNLFSWSQLLDGVSKISAFHKQNTAVGVENGKELKQIEHFLDILRKMYFELNHFFMSKICENECIQTFEDILRISNQELRKDNPDKLIDLVCERFQELTDEYMKSEGFCCGELYPRFPDRRCHSRSGCLIRRFGKYFNCDKSILNTDVDYDLCDKCYDKFCRSEHTRTMARQFNICMSCFMRMKNTNKFVSKLNEEERIRCTNCGKKWHKFCAMSMNQFDNLPFRCPNCKPSISTSELINVGKSELSEFIETRVNEFCSRNIHRHQKVIIRVIADILKNPENSRSYREKGIFAFQICPDNNYVCFFAFYVREIEDRAFIISLDSIPLFTPSEEQTKIQSNILCAYIDQIKRYGFVEICLPSIQKSPIVYTRGQLKHKEYAQLYGEVIKEVFSPNPSVENVSIYYRYQNNPRLEGLREVLTRNRIPEVGTMSENFRYVLTKLFSKIGPSRLVIALQPATRRLSDYYGPDFHIENFKDTETFYQWCKSNELYLCTKRAAKFLAKAIFYELSKHQNPQLREGGIY